MSTVLDSPQQMTVPERISADDPMTWEAPDGEQWFVIPGVDYAAYVTICDALPDTRTRMTFDGENLIFMVNSRNHERWSRILYRMIVILTEEMDLPLGSCGSMTCRRDLAKRGAEPDECFYITHEPEIRHREDFDLESAPPPDLVIEIDASRSSVGKLPIYAKLQVPEIWRYNKVEVLCYVLQADGSYLLVERSPTFHWLSAAMLSDWMTKFAQQDENTFFRQFRTWVREQLASAEP